jgi:NADH:ubiquinone oxidoreductase subunit H
MGIPYGVKPLYGNVCRTNLPVIVFQFCDRLTRIRDLSRGHKTSLVEGLFIIPLVLGVAYTTLADRKGLAILQRRLGPETVGLLGVLQPFSDAVKLLVKELVHTEGSKPLLTMALPVITLGCNLGGYAFLPIVVSVLLVDLPLHILATAGLIGLGVHGVLYIA